MEALGACTGDSLYRAIAASWRLYRGFPVQQRNSSIRFQKPVLPVQGIPCTGQGPAADGRSRVGGDLEESIPKGIDAGLLARSLCERSSLERSESKQPGYIPASLHGRAVASLKEARWPDPRGARPSAAGH